MIDNFNIELRLAKIEEMIRHLINYQDAKLQVAQVQTVDPLTGEVRVLQMTKMAPTPHGVVIQVKL